MFFLSRKLFLQGHKSYKNLKQNDKETILHVNLKKVELYHFVKNLAKKKEKVSFCKETVYVIDISTFFTIY